MNDTGTVRCATHPDDFGQYPLFFQDLQRSHICDAFHSAAFEHQIAKMIRHGSPPFLTENF